jgi:hypothetical protein
MCCCNICLNRDLFSGRTCKTCSIGCLAEIYSPVQPLPACVLAVTGLHLGSISVLWDRCAGNVVVFATLSLLS